MHWGAVANGGKTYPMGTTCTIASADRGLTKPPRRRRPLPAREGCEECRRGRIDAVGRRVKRGSGDGDLPSFLELAAVEERSVHEDPSGGCTRGEIIA